jgi:hypothetical protein
LIGKKHLFTREMLEQLKEKGRIEIYLYNKDGQVITPPRENLSEKDVSRILNFSHQGMYFKNEDLEYVQQNFIPEPEPTPEPEPEPNVVEENLLYEGLTNEKLIAENAAADLTASATELLEELRNKPLLEIQSTKLKGQLTDIFHDFEGHPEAMNGLVNVIGVLGGKDSLPAPEIAMKRTIIAMAIKTRGFKASNTNDRKYMDEKVANLMMSAMLCDVGYIKMKEMHHNGLSDKEMDYVRMHPLYSYMLIVHDETLSDTVKYNVLCHHRPLVEAANKNNNFPNLVWMREKLRILQENIKDPEKKAHIQRDVDKQLDLLKHHPKYDEDLCILALTSEFASLTTKTGWREAFDPVDAIKMIINNSYFTYPDRIIRDFLDHISVSLCENRKIIQEGDYVVMASAGSQGSTFWDIGTVVRSGRYQSRPEVNIFAKIQPSIKDQPKLIIEGFNLMTLSSYPRPINIKLDQEIQRRIVYIIEERWHERLYNAVMKISPY